MECINLTPSNDLDTKMNSILSIIEQDDGDSFAKRAEMYYQKRPQLIQMVEDLHKSYRSLAEKYDQLRSQLNHHPSHPTLLSSSSRKEMNGSVQHSSNLDCKSTSEDPDVETEVDNNFSKWEEADDDHHHDPKMKPNVKGNTMNGIGIQRNISDGYKAAMLEHDKLWKELRFKVSELVLEDNLSHQAELIKRNDHEKRQTIRDVCFKMKMDENKAVNGTHKLTKKTTRFTQASRLKRLFFGWFMK